MDHAFVVTRHDTASSADQRKAPIEAGTDKALKNFEARTHVRASPTTSTMGMPSR
jgi:hypothetical protein